MGGGSVVGVGGLWGGGGFYGDLWLFQLAKGGAGRKMGRSIDK